MRKILFIALAIVHCQLILNAQGVTVGTNNPPDPTAILDVQSVAKGFLGPRLTTSQRNAIVSPAAGLQVYNTTTNCLEVYLPLSGWRDVTCDCQGGPSSAFTFPNQINVNAAATFVASTPGMTYAWIFPSGSPASSINQSQAVTWVVAGNYTVTLTVTDNLGCSSTTTQQITVNNCPPPGGNVVSFSFTGGAQQFTVPACATSLDIEVWGAEGVRANAGPSYIPGKGGYAKGTLANPTPGEVLEIYVGGQNGYNGGGSGWTGSSEAANGGGASDVRRAGNALADRIIVGGGGGGVGGESNWGNGGNGGGGTCGANYCGGAGGGGYGFTGGVGALNGGAAGTNCHGGGGGGGGLNSGGAGAVSNCYGIATAGTGQLGVGGVGAANLAGCCQSYGVGGGGGGYYGGGGSAGGCCGGGGGGGGSSWTGSLTNPSFSAGIRSGNGQVTITY